MRFNGEGVEPKILRIIEEGLPKLYKGQGGGDIKHCSLPVRTEWMYPKNWLKNCSCIWNFNSAVNWSLIKEINLLPPTPDQMTLQGVQCRMGFPTNHSLALLCIHEYISHNV